MKDRESELNEDTELWSFLFFQRKSVTTVTEPTANSNWLGWNTAILVTITHRL